MKKKYAKPKLEIIELVCCDEVANLSIPIYSAENDPDGAGWGKLI